METPASPNPEVKRLEQVIKEFSEENDQYRQSSKELKTIIRNNNVVLIELDNTIKIKEAACKEAEQVYEELKKKLAEAKEEYEKKQEDFRAVKEICAEKKRESEDCELKLKELKGKIHTNMLSVEQLRKNLDELQYSEWFALLRTWQDSQSITQAMKIRNKVEIALKEGIGIPDNCRGLSWKAISPYLVLKKEVSKGRDDLFLKLIEQRSSFETNIEKDVHRTFPNSEFVRRLSDGDRLQALFNVLKGYSNWDPNLGYCQGMNFLVGFLLLYMDQESAFFMLISILKNYKMLGLFQQGPLLALFLKRFDEELKYQLPELHEHMRVENVRPMMYITEWFTTMYVYNLPIGTVAQIWDHFFFGNGPEVLFRVGIAMLKIYEESLRQMSMEEMLDLVKKKIRNVDPMQLMTVTREVRLQSATHALLDSVQVNWQTFPDGSRKLAFFLRQCGPDCEECNS